MRCRSHRSDLHRQERGKGARRLVQRRRGTHRNRLLHPAPRPQDQKTKSNRQLLGKGHVVNKETGKLVRQRMTAREEYVFLAAAKRGDSAAFETLCKQAATTVFHIAWRIMRNNEDAE